MVRLDGQYGNGAIVADLAGLAYVIRGKDYGFLDLQEVQARLALPPDQQTTHPETGTCRTLFDCPEVPLTATGARTRMIVATHPASTSASPIGTNRAGVVYELFFTARPQDAFTPADVVDLYLHRGAFETVLADEDKEQDPDRWCSHTACGQEAWQILSRWIWNLRLELGHRLHPMPMRTTEFAPVQAPSDCAPRPSESAPVTYGLPQWARPSVIGGYQGAAFVLQPDGTLRCPAHHPLYPQERRPEHNGSVRLLYAARIGHCRPCSLRSQCQESSFTTKPRRGSRVLWPIEGPPPEPAVPPALPLASHPLLWGDWN